MPDSLPLTALLDAAAPWATGTLLLTTRLGMVVIYLPGFATGQLPARTRGLFALFVGVGLSLALGGLSVPPPDGPLSALALFGREVVIGAGLGLAVRVVLAAFDAAGAHASTNMGLALNVFVDPTTGDETMPLGQAFAFAAALAFIAVGADHVVLETVAGHLERVPVGEASWTAPDPATLGRQLQDLATTAFVLSAPVTVISFVMNLAMGLVGKVVPSVNIFGIGVSLLVIAGFLALDDAGAAAVYTLHESLDTLPDRMVDMGGAGATAGPPAAPSRP